MKFLISPMTTESHVIGRLPKLFMPREHEKGGGCNRCGQHCPDKCGSKCSFKV